MPEINAHLADFWVNPPFLDINPIPATVDASFFSSEGPGAASALFDVPAWTYDAIMAIGIAMCTGSNSTSGYPPLPQHRELYEAMLHVDFQGLSGRVKFSEDGDRDPTTEWVELKNFVWTADGEVEKHSVGSYITNRAWALDGREVSLGLWFFLGVIFMLIILIYLVFTLWCVLYIHISLALCVPTQQMQYPPNNSLNIFYFKLH